MSLSRNATGRVPERWSSDGKTPVSETRTVTSCIFTINVQCVHIAAGRRIQAGDATNQRRDQ